jgi:demethylmenaquinone methyltransferase / 2-methoxy-6-polyprenyl-1,4-benzoquinol methylase
MPSAPVTSGLPTGAEKTRRVREMFDAIAPRYELANRVLSLGLDARWRTAAIRSLGLPAGGLVLDVATGTGNLASAAQRAGLDVVGVDLSLGMLQAATSGAPVLQCDVVELPFADGIADGVVCGYALRNFTDLAGSLAEMARVLRPGGRVALLEVGDPDRALTKAGYRAWFNHVVPVLGGLLSDKDAYRYLPKSVAYLPSPDELREQLRQAGLSGVNRHLLSGGLSQLYTATRAGRR